MINSKARTKEKIEDALLKVLYCIYISPCVLFSHNKLEQKFWELSMGFMQDAIERQSIDLLHSLRCLEGAARGRVHLRVVPCFLDVSDTPPSGQERLSSFLLWDFYITLGDPYRERARKP